MVAAFLGGTTILLDIVGPEGLISYGDRIYRQPYTRPRHRAYLRIILITALMCASLYLNALLNGVTQRLALQVLIGAGFMFCVFSFLFTLLMYGSVFLRGVAWVLQKRTLARVWRTFSLALLTLAFILTLFAS